jgi:homoserine dehydrogenase
MGFGNVGKAFAKLLAQKANEIEKESRISLQISAIATGNHGWAINHSGINPADAIEIYSRNGSLDSLSSVTLPEKVQEFIPLSKADFLLEITPVNYSSGEPAVSHIETALENRMHVVSANKGPVVHAYDHLTDLAREQGKQFLFESAVMDGAPIFSVFREALPTAKVLGFEGILNSCTNLLIEKMEQGSSFEDAVAYAQSIGIAETDPSGDIDGWDAAIKVAALATVLMGIPLKPQDINRKGIRNLDPAMIHKSINEGKRWKLVCSAEKKGGKITAVVGPKLVSPSSSLFSVNGTSSFVLFKTDVLPGFGILESDPGPETTAYGLLADILNILK